MIRHSSSTLQSSDFDYVVDLLARNYIGDGQYCDKFRQALSRTLDRTTAILTDSGEDALLLALLTLKKKSPSRSRVMVSVYVCPSVINAILAAGLEPKFVDIEKNSLNIDSESIMNQYDESVLTVIYTHIAGIPDLILPKETLDIPIISDCAQAIGSKISGRDVTSYGDIGILSFGPTKVLTGGSGGAIVTSNPKYSDIIQSLSRAELSVEEYLRSGFQQTHGQHFSDLIAGLALAQYLHLPAFIARRRQIAQEYDFCLAECSEVELIAEPTDHQWNRFRYYFFSDSAPQIISHLNGLGIDARASISHNMSQYWKTDQQFKNMSMRSNSVVSLPIYPGLSDKVVDQIKSALNLWQKD